MTGLQVLHGAAVLAGEVRGSGTTLVLLHAGVTDRRSWTDVARGLAQDHRVIDYDRRGFGETTYAPEAFSHVDDLVAVLDATDTDRAVLIGNSQGGRIALDAALLHPERVAGLVLVGSAVSGLVWPEVTETVAAIDAAIEAAEDAGDHDAVNALEAHLWLDGPGQEARITGALRDLFLDMNGRALRAPDPGPQPLLPATWDRLDEIATPATVTVGSLDLPAMVTVSRELASRLPAGRFELFEGAAHLPGFEAPERFVELVRRSI